METMIWRPEQDDNWLIEAVSILKSGGIIAFPTESSYGLAVDIYNSKAMNKLFEVKGRDFNKSVSVLVTNSKQVSDLTETKNESADLLMETYWPGPLTIVFKGKDKHTIAIRHSSHKIANMLINSFEKPITATSANVAGQPNAYSVSDVLGYFQGKIDGIVDVGSLPLQPVSTLIDTTVYPPQVLREAAIPATDIMNRLGLL